MTVNLDIKLDLCRAVAGTNNVLLPDRFLGNERPIPTLTVARPEMWRSAESRPPARS